MYHCYSCLNDSEFLNSDHGCPRCNSDFIDTIPGTGNDRPDPSESYDPDFPGPRGEPLAAVVANNMGSLSLDNENNPDAQTQSSAPVNRSRSDPRRPTHPFGVFSTPIVRNRALGGVYQRGAPRIPERPDDYYVTADGEIIPARPRRRGFAGFPDYRRRERTIPEHFVSDSPIIIAHQNWIHRLKITLESKVECIICLTDLEPGSEAYLCKHHPYCPSCTSHSTKTKQHIKRNCTVCKLLLW